MPQFTLKRLLASTAMIAIGCGVLGMFQGTRPEPIRENSLAFFCLLAGPSLIGAGIGNIFHRAAYGVLLIWLLIFAAGLAFLMFALS
jgi:hypothetical protein